MSIFEQNMDENAVRVNALESYWKEQHFENPFVFETWKSMLVELENERFACTEFNQWYGGGNFNWMRDPIENLPSWIKLGRISASCRIKIAGKDSDCVPERCHNLTLRCDDKLGPCSIYAISSVTLSLWEEPEDINVCVETNSVTKLKDIRTVSHPDNYAHFDVCASPFSKHYLKHIHFQQGRLVDKSWKSDDVRCITIGCENTPLETELQEIWGDFEKGTNMHNFNFKKLFELYDYIDMPDNYGIWFRFNNPITCYLFIGRDEEGNYHIHNDYSIAVV